MPSTSFGTDRTNVATEASQPVKEQLSMSAVLEEDLNVVCTFCEDGGGVFINSADGIRCGDCGKKCVPVEPEDTHGPESEAPEKTATDPLSDAFEEHLEEQQQTDEATDQAPDDATEQAHPEEPTLVVDTQTNNLVEPEDQTFDTPREQQTPEVAPAPKSELAPEPLTLVQSAEPTPAPNPAAVSVNATATNVDAEMYTAAEVEEIKQQQANEMLAEVEPVLAASQQRNQELETQLKTMTSMYEKMMAEKMAANKELEQIAGLTQTMEGKLEAELQAAQRANKLLCINNETLEAAKDAAEEELSSLQETMQQLNSLVTKFQKAETVMSERIEKAEQENVQHGARWDALKTQAEEKLGLANQEIDRLTSTLQQMDSANKEHQSKLSSTQAQLEEANRERAEAVSRCSASEEKEAAAQQAVTSLQQELDNANTKANEAQEQLADAQKAEKIAQAEVSNFKAQMIEQGTLLSTARVELADAKERLQAVTQKANADSNESSVASTRISELERERDDLIIKNHDLQKAAANSSAGGSSTEVAALQAALEEQKAAVAKVEAEKAELQKVCDELFQMVEAKGGA